MSGCSSPSGVRFSYNDYDNWNSNSNVSSHLCKIIFIADPAHTAKDNNLTKGVGTVQEDDFLKAKAFETNK